MWGLEEGDSPCPACGEGRPASFTQVVDHEYGLDVVARYADCCRCGSLYQDPMPSLAALAGYYPVDYHSFSGNRMLVAIRQDLRIRRLEQLLTGPGAALDFGCGAGQFLLQAADRLPDVTFYGYEIGEKTSIERHREGQVTIVRGVLEALWDHLPPCRVITLNHVIEHLPNPADTLSRLSNSLVAGGALEGQTPAANALERTIFGRRWSGFHAPRHTVVFSPKGLHRLLASSGFELVKISQAFNPASWAISIGSALHGPGPGAIKRRGLGWLLLLGLGSLGATLDLSSRRSAVVNFTAHKR